MKILCKVTYISAKDGIAHFTDEITLNVYKIKTASVKIGDYAYISASSSPSIIEILNPKMYDVHIDAKIPALLKYRVLACTPEQAVEKAKISQPISIEYCHTRTKWLRIVIYEAGTKLIKFLKNIGV